MRVVAIDSAPGKKSTVYCAEKGFRQKSGEEMREFLESLESPVLLCWDAPLTGPREPDSPKVGQPGDFTQRCIESFFRRKKTEFTTPKGIFVGGYAGLQHWTISRSVLGLPRVGPYDAKHECLRFHLLTEGDGQDVARMNRKCVVEIHPAVAAWLWCRNEPEFEEWDKGWMYKKDKEIRDEMWNVIQRRCDDELHEGLPDRKPKNDDEFDAIIGYILGRKWLRGCKDVGLLGDRENGAMLLPLEAELCDAWENFRSDVCG